MHVQFWGAARTVTGSMHILTIGGEKFLLDCGTYHGRRAESFERNSSFPLDPTSISAVVLSHAHIDHSGNLPRLVKQGFRGPIYCTPATKSLCDVMLKDSAYIQERDVEYINKRHKKKHLPLLDPLYTVQDVANTLPLFEPKHYSVAFDIADNVSCRFEDAGHILGSASVAVRMRENGSVRTLAFTGDLGRPHLPILRDPIFIGDDTTSILITESTYGGRFHNPVDQMQDQLRESIQRAVDRKGKIVIPAFSVGRTQDIVYELHALITEGKLDPLPVYVDSPLSVNVTDVFRRHVECFDRETLDILRSPIHNDPFGFERLQYIKTLEESKALNDRPGPFIVISASGMCEAGRVVHHLANTIADPRNMVLIVGYQAENTLGKKIVNRESTVNIFGEPHDLRAEVVVLNSFSAHADRNELVGYLRQFDKRKLKNIFVVHGDPDQSAKLQNGLQEIGFAHVAIPDRGDRVTLE